MTKRLRADGEDSRIFRTLVEEGVNLHCELIPRSRFKRMVEGSARTAFRYSFFARRRLVHCADASLAKWFEQADTLARRDQDRELCIATTWLIHGHRSAARLLEIKGDLDLAFQELLGCAHCVAAAEVIASGEIHEGLAIDRALSIAPALMGKLYLQLLSGARTRPELDEKLLAFDEYLGAHAETRLRPVLSYLRKEGRLVSLSELSDYFAHSQLFPWHLESACEWLERKGFLQKLSAPLGPSRPYEAQPGGSGRARLPVRIAMKSKVPEAMRTTLLVRGARENNLRNVTVELPRNQLVVFTGVSGSGKSSLAFDTIYAEGQRRLLASMSAYAKRFVNQLRKPDVDFVHGLSPVISVDQ